MSILDLNVQMNDLSKINPLLKRPKVKELEKSNRISKIILPGINHRDNICTNLKIISSVKHNLNAKDFSSVTNKLDVNSVSRVAVNNGQLIGIDCNTNKTLNNKNTIKITKILRLLPSDNQKYGGRKITVVRCNPGGKGRTSLTVMMARRSVHTLGQVMCELTEAFGSRWHNDPIRNLYSLTGREIKSVNELFRKDKVFIASGLHKMFGNIHIELNKSNNVDSNTTRANNYINNCIHQSMSCNNCQKSFHHGFLSNQDKNGNIVRSNATELKPEDIRVC
uniref:Doublecortin domain-containing protein n=1 Tax=Schistosoma mansoni TaxID=6183 RepID=A0A5K4F1L4_SCHMA